MQGEFKQCSNGHYYQGSQCPYCKTDNQHGNSTSLKTEVFMGNIEDQATATATTTSYGARSVYSETLNDDNTFDKNPRPTANYSRTVFGDEEENNAQATPRKDTRYGRKLVGWLVTYSFDELGADYKLYEGRNIIGRDHDCNITVSDGRMSGKHAVLLFRANKYSLTDSQSSHGTFVNDEDIELEPRYLKDGDIIRMGNTIFKFRTSL